MSHYRTICRATNVRTKAVCLFDKDTTVVKPLLYLAEQVFVLLLNTYSDRVTGFDLGSVSFQLGQCRMEEMAVLLTQAAAQAQTATGWPEGRLRDSFGVQKGLNVSSPLLEVANQREKNLCL